MEEAVEVDVVVVVAVAAAVDAATAAAAVGSVRLSHLRCWLAVGGYHSRRG